MASAFDHFVSMFPLADLPVSITLDSHREFELINDLVPPILVDQFIMQEEELPEEEYTEILPCFKLPDKNEFIALVYWKASLLRYDFILATYTKKGIPISRQVIAGTSSDGRRITKKLATIQEDGSIDIISSTQEADELHFNPALSQELNYELMPDGFIATLNEN